MPYQIRPADAEHECRQSSVLSDEGGCRPPEHAPLVVSLLDQQSKSRSGGRLGGRLAPSSASSSAAALTMRISATDLMLLLYVD